VIREFRTTDQFEVIKPKGKYDAMTVRELIAKPKRYDPDMPVIVPSLEYFNAVTVVDRANANPIDEGEFDVVDGRGGEAVVLIS
jgi:hypothetical protein